MLPAALFLLLFAVLWAVYNLVLPAAWRGGRRLWSAVTRSLLRRQRMASWYERGAVRWRPLHPYRPAVFIVLAGFVAAALTGAVFFQLAEAVHEHSVALQAVDQRAWEAARLLRSPAATVFFTAFTLLGTPVGFTAVVVLAVVALLVRGRRVLPMFLVFATLGAWALNVALKAIFARARPDLTLALRNSSGYSFPSGHAMISVVAFGSLGYVALRIWSSPRMRSAALALVTSVVVAVSVSRVYLGVHWLSDIVAGVAAGLVWLTAVVASYEVFRRLKMIRSAPRPADWTRSPGNLRSSPSVSE